MSLNPRESLFCAEYVANGFNAVRAYMVAYKTENRNVAGVEGHKLLKKPKIQVELARFTKSSFDRCEISTDYVVKTIHETIERCKQATPVLDSRGRPVEVETPDGQVAPAYIFDSKGVLKGAELLGRFLKMFTDRVEHTGGIVLKHEVSRPER